MNYKYLFIIILFILFILFYSIKHEGFNINPIMSGAFIVNMDKNWKVLVIYYKMVNYYFVTVDIDNYLDDESFEWGKAMKMIDERVKSQGFTVVNGFYSPDISKQLDEGMERVFIDDYKLDEGQTFILLKTKININNFIGLTKKLQNEQKIVYWEII